ncbi:MAG: hypothetical protein J6C93_04950, partial [Clostridia bacterium]|nr:hypothetical protein [Clostridia bacterium]
MRVRIASPLPSVSSFFGGTLFAFLGTNAQRLRVTLRLSPCYSASLTHRTTHAKRFIIFWWNAFCFFGNERATVACDASAFALLFRFAYASH